MKKHTRLLAALLCLVMMISTLTSCGIIEGLIKPETPDVGGNVVDKPHTCESKCSKCGKCLDKSCKEEACKAKCAGHSGAPAHTCESVCSTCGKCLDLECIYDVCRDKCNGHAPAHTCESVCEECGKCLDSFCTDSACDDKCDGHSEDAKAAAYGYMPIIRNEMAAIYINTPDGSNSWATSYNRNDKLAGRIDYVDATVSVDNCEEDYEMTDVAAEVKVRGNYTLDYPKDPIRIKFNKKANMLGLHDGEKYKNWVLLADWKDLSMSNNTVAFYLGNTILGSDGYYCTDFRNVEVYLNGQYWGMYLLVEQQEAKDGRSSVPEVPEEDDVGYTGNDIGYFFEFDGYWNLEGEDGDPTFTINHQGLPTGNNGYTVKSDIYADSQLQFLKNYMEKAFYIAYQANYKDTYYKFNEDFTEVVAAPEITSSKQAVANVIDLQALVDMYILNEIAKDLDFDWSSIYLSLNMTAEGNKKITFEAPWDFDSCFGIINRENCSATNDMYAANDENPWIQLVKNEDWFWDMVYEKWAEMKEYNLFENVIKLVETEKATYKDYYIKNFTRWSERVSNGNGECVSQLNSYKDVNTAQGLAADYLINWLKARFAYLDGQFSKEEVIAAPVNPEAYGYMPIIRNEMAAIYINTSDGSNEWATKYGQADKKADRIKYVNATISVDNCEEKYEMTDVAAEVKVRGNATLSYAKKPIRIKFSKKANLLGLHDGEKYKNWVLLADWKDLSMSNNTVAFYLGQTILGSDGYYCTDFRNVEVYLNGQYWGMYLLVEQQEAKDGRSSVPEVEDDYTGNDIGYFFEYDGYYTDEINMPNGAGDPTFTMTYPSGATYRSGIGYTIKSDIYADSQIEFLRTYMNNVYYIAFEATKGNYYKFDENYNVVANTSAYSTKSVVASVIDIQSLVDVYILNEIACDLDVDWSSFYLSLNMTTEGNKKVTFEAPWDWDSCFGLRSDINNMVPNAQGMYVIEKKNNPWFELLSGQDWFWDMVRAKWAQMVENNLLENTINMVKAEKETYKDYYIKNFTEKWSSRVTGGNTECNATLQSFRDVNTAQGLAADFLIDWLTKRFTYLDKQWGKGEFGQIKVDENLPEGAVAYKYEAENAALANFTDSAPIRDNRDYASGNAYVGGTINGATITFTINASEATTVYLFAAVSKMGYSASFDTWFSIKVNGVELALPVRNVDKVSGGEEAWHTFVNVKLLPIELKEGENTIVFNCLVERNNLDYIELYSPVELS